MEGGETEIKRAYTLKAAKTAGTGDWNDSRLIKEGYVGRVEDEPVTEELDSIRVELMRCPAQLYEMLANESRREAAERIEMLKARLGEQTAAAMCKRSGRADAGGRKRQTLGTSGNSAGEIGVKGLQHDREVGHGDVAGRLQDRHGRVIQRQPPPPPCIEEEELGGSQDKVGLCEKKEGAYTARDLGGGQGRRQRPRGRRQRGQGRCEVIMVNSSGMPQLLGVVQKANERKGKVGAILCQEHHAGEGQVGDVQAALREAHWRAAIAPATVGEGGGRSAGVAVLAPSHIGCGRIKGAEDVSPKGSEGRLAVAWVQSIVPCGIVAISAYLHTCEGPSPRNVRLLAEALQVARASESPWIIGADFQDSPEEVGRWASGMLERAGGRLVYTESPTVYPSTGKPRVIDFFIVSDTLAPFMDSIRIFGEAAASPHRALIITFKGVSEPKWQWTLRTPRRFPRDKPIGCARHPIAPGEGFLEGVRNAAGGEAKAEMGKAWRDMALAIEAELCGVTDRYSGSGPDRRWCGRGDGARFVKAPLLPARAMGEWGRLDTEGYRILWALNRIEELASLARIARLRVSEGFRVSDGEQVFFEKAKQLQWDRLVRKCTSPNSPIACIGDERDKWMTWIGLMKAVIDMPWEAVDLLESTAEWAAVKLDKRKKEHQLSRAKGWWKWVKEQRVAGGGALHKYVKRKKEQLDEVFKVEGFNTAAAQCVVDKETEGWREIWGRVGAAAMTPWRGSGCSNEHVGVARPTVKELRVAARSFKSRTGCGTDALPPRAFGWLSDQLLEKLAEMLEATEKIGCWPEQLEEALIHLIAKEAGGKRPIGLVTALPRIWARVRRAQVNKWRSENARNYNWMTKGRGAGRAVWAQSVLEEAARQRGLESGSVLIDLIKAFDHLLLAEIWKAGVAHGFPMNLLVLSLECSAFNRRLVYRGACSTVGVQTFAAVLPGLEHSTDFMLLALMGPLDRLLRAHQGIHIFLIADDTKIGMVGTEEEVEKGLIAATEDCIREMEEGLKMKVSRNQGGFKGKTVALASCTKLGKKLRGRMGKMGIEIRHSTRNLGVDYGGGRGKVKKKMQKSRWCIGQLKSARAMRLGGAATGIIRSGIIPSITYGTEVTGVTDGMLKGWRTMVAKSFGNLGGRSASARLALEGVDPGKKVVVEAIMCWVCAWWDELMPKDEMMDSWKYAIKGVGMAARPNAEVRGGGGAFFAALRRINWTSPAPDAVRTSGGTILYFGKGRTPREAYMADPRAVRRWVEDEYEKAAAMHSQVARDVNDIKGTRGYPRAKDMMEEKVGAAVYGDTGHECDLADKWRRAKFEINKEIKEEAIIPWYWPAATVIKNLKKRGLYKAAASLRSCMEGGWLTQRKLWAEGRVENDKCRCGKAAGTLWHKLAVCELSEETRTTAVEPRGLKDLIATGVASVWDPLFSRGVPGRPKWPAPPDKGRWWCAEVEGATEIATGDVYTDGSALGAHWRVIRAGWAAVAVDNEGQILWRMGGTCGEPHASILRAELTAVLETLKIATAPVCIHVDNSTVVRGFEEGREWCVSAGRDGADLWREVWDQMKEVGEGVRVVKVRAHTTWWDVIFGRISARDQGGNDVADKEAKRALKEALRRSPTASVNASIARAIGWAKWIASYAGGWIKDTSVDPVGEEESARRGASEEGTTARERTTLGHEVWDMKGTWLCRRCGRQSANEDEGRALKSSPCAGSAGGRAVAHATGNVNYIWNMHALATTGLLQQGARLIRRSNIPAEMVDAARCAEMEGEYAETLRRDLRNVEGQEAGVTGRGVAVGERHFEQGVRGERWVMPWERDPRWLYLPHLQEGRGQGKATWTEAGLGGEVRSARLVGGHWLRTTGALVWCSRCACFAFKRHGRGL